MSRIFRSVLSFVKKEVVLCISLLCAVLSCLLSPPTAQELIGDIDFRVLSLLFCLMACVAGLTRAGLMRRLSALLLTRAKNGLQLGTLLVLSCFFLSMLMTNDVALITFVPLTVLVLSRAKLENLQIPVIVLETIAANLGSALTPVGNPQNLYLYTSYALTPGEFFSVTLPLAALSLLLLLIALLFLPKTPLKAPAAEVSSEEKPDRRALLLHGGLFLLCLLSVFSVLPRAVLLPVVLLALLLWDRPTLKSVDYALLLTFVCFFLFSGNLSRMPAVRELLEGWMSKDAFLASLLTSQVISNVPAALLLRPFTSDSAALILGTDVGGLGTPVASLASLISFKSYLRSENAKGGRYLLVFLLLNLVFLFPLILLSLLLLRV